MGISLCLLARNERLNLARAVRSFGGIADETVVLDTGSTDGTPELAAALGCRVESFPWCDDFSAARNAQIETAREEWIFLLDCDEWLEPAFADEVRRAAACDNVLVWNIIRRDYKSLPPEGAFSEMYVPRLIRRRNDVRFVGRCHPQFTSNITHTAQAQGMAVMPSTIRIGHDGYLPKFLDAKLHRAARLLELELHERPGQLYYQIELARTLLMLGDRRGHAIFIEVARAMDQYRDAAEPPTPMLAAAMEYFLRLKGESTTIPFTHRQLVQLSRRWFPDSAPLLWLNAVQSYEAAEFGPAATALERLVRMGTDHSYDKFCSFDPAIVGDDAKLNLGVCYIRLGRLAEAAAIFQALMASKHRAAAEANLRSIAEIKRVMGSP